MCKKGPLTTYISNEKTEENINFQANSKINHNPFNVKNALSLHLKMATLTSAFTG